MVLTCDNCGSARIVPADTGDPGRYRCDECGAFIDIEVKGARLEVGGKRVPSRNEPDPTWTSIAFRVTREQKVNVIIPALELERQMAEMTGRRWRGVALENICADFLAGAPSMLPAPATAGLDPEGPGCYTQEVRLADDQPQDAPESGDCSECRYKSSCCNPRKEI